jgi:hypothetical protein
MPLQFKFLLVRNGDGPKKFREEKFELRSQMIKA